jgi:hypothetical protein
MNKKLASDSVGKIAELYAGHDGNYICEVERILPGSCNIAVVKILACIKYPGQRAIFYTFNNFERWPFDYVHIETCHIDCLELYFGVVPEYYELMPKVLEETFIVETEADREIFDRHKKYWEGKRGIYG